MTLKSISESQIAALWQEIEKIVSSVQDTWLEENGVDEALIADVKNGDFLLLTEEQVAEIKDLIEIKVRLALRTNLWEDFLEEEYVAVLQLIHDFVFIGNSYIHNSFIAHFNPEMMSYDSMWMLMQTWLIAYGSQLNEFSIQERNLEIDTKVHQLNDYFFSTPLSDKLIAGIIISLQAAYSKKVIEDNIEIYGAPNNLGIGMWYMHKRDLFVQANDVLLKALPDYETLILADIEDIEEISMIGLLNGLIQQTTETVSLGEYRFLGQGVAFMRMKYMMSNPNMTPYTEIQKIPLGLLGLMTLLATHSLFLEKVETNDSYGYVINRFNLAQMEDDAEGLKFFLELYMKSIPDMYGELATYNKEYMREITLSFTDHIKYCFPNQLKNHDMASIVDGLLENK